MELQFQNWNPRLELGQPRAHASRLRGPESFEDSGKLLAAADAMKLEGIVSKRRDGRYRSGTRSGWIKVKAATWREVNWDRGELFENT